MNISKLAAGWVLRCSSPPLISLLGEDNFIPVASPWLICLDCKAGGQGVFLALFQGDSSLAGVSGIPDSSGKHRGSKEQEGCLCKERVQKWTKMPSCEGAARNGGIFKAAQLTQRPVCWIITGSRWL